MRKSRFSSGDALEELDNGAALFAAIKWNGGIRIELRIRGGRRLMHSSALTSRRKRKRISETGFLEMDNTRLHIVTGVCFKINFGREIRYNVERNKVGMGARVRKMKFG